MPNPFLTCATVPVAKKNHDCALTFLAVSLFLLGLLSACTSSNRRSGATAPLIGTTLRGCLERSQGNYVVIQKKTGTRFTLVGVGNKVEKLIGHEVEITGTLELAPSTADSLSSKEPDSANVTPVMDQPPLKIENVRTDIVSIANHCQAPK